MRSLSVLRFEPIGSEPPGSALHSIERPIEPCGISPLGTVPLNPARHGCSSNHAAPLYMAPPRTAPPRTVPLHTALRRTAPLQAAPPRHTTPLRDHSGRQGAAGEFRAARFRAAPCWAVCQHEMPSGPRTDRPGLTRATAAFAAAALAAGSALLLAAAGASASDRLVGRAVLPAATFAEGPTSGTRLGSGPINGQPVPFVDKQLVQGFSAVLDNGDGTFDVMSDNGFGSIENSADYHLRVYTIRPVFETGMGARDGDDRDDGPHGARRRREGPRGGDRGGRDHDGPHRRGSGTIRVERFIELHDPDRKIPFAITNHFTERRVLTGADFDIESMQRAPDGTLWFGDEFGPFLLHTDARGRVLEAPIPLPDFDNPGREIRARQNPFNEEGSAVRIMNAVQAHARRHGNTRAPVFSPWEALLDDGNPATAAATRAAPPAGSDLSPASSEIFDVGLLQRAGFPVVVWTVNDKARMLELMRLGVNGIISDRPDLLLEAVREFDANSDGVPGDFLTPEGLVDPAKFDAQGHRGARSLRPENTLPAMEAALDALVSTLEADTGITADGVPVVDHDPLVASAKCRRADGAPYTPADEVLVRDLTLAQLQTTFICDRLLPDRPQQRNDPALSPVAAAFAAEHGLPHPYVMPSLQQLFDFVAYYAAYYRSGPGAGHPDAARRWRNAERVRFNIETKRNPRPEFVHRTVGAEAFAQAVGGVIEANGLAERADIQSFDFATLLAVHERFPQIRTVFLFGDFPVFADPSVPGSDDGTNLQPDASGNTPWLAGLFWPYRVTASDQPFRAATSGGFEGMALAADGRRLLPLLERPLEGGEPNTLLIHEFDLATREYTGVRYRYPLDPRGSNIGDFVMFGPRRGLVIERDGSQGRLDGFKAIYEIELRGAGEVVGKRLAVDLLRIDDPRRISEPAKPGDVGLGRTFAFPFVTIEGVVVFDRKRIGVLNDNNFPFSVGRHAGSGRPDDSEFIIIELDRPLGAGPIR